ncbi:hypothetical protein BU24DRAFT_423040 [Aaosphaeria arxii CBS 175.79]|uniref:C2H2-type domain-containing protein n=1 Tax=Aaosphaeria arxii CBS 175.79 TaxID=1450172 RepID=A0A6A5XUN4_9PLEO|nr:uncharacterized protein BU24DRAFT_423040 [Aaosphaeria arxii CBS 175.79]KAF2016663.1 hypothetical protein BU24DRAFT_423040 [Aaosphaeria arxii CBS 175.79]
MDKVHLSTRVDACGRGFVSLSQALTESERYGDQVRPQAIQDEFDRFKIWAGNIAAHRKGRRSLEYRLRDAAHLKAETENLLIALQESLSDALAIVKGERVPWDELDDSDTDSESDIDSDDGADLKSDTELQQLNASVKNTVTCLFRLSMSIRDPAPNSQYRSTIIVDKSYFEAHDIQHVRAKFEVEDNYLSERLGKAISGRRQYLSYREEHHNKLAKKVETIGFEEPRTEHTTNSTEASPLPKIAVEDSSTIVDNDDALSQTSYASSVNSTIRIPPLPKIAREEEYFECPLCFMIVSIHTTAAWKQHVYRDLHPYCCTFEHCTTADRLYDSRHAWFQHELEAHRTAWQCVEGCEKLFNNEPDFDSHVKDTHPEISGDQMMFALKRTATRSAKLADITICSLCGKEMTLRALQKHLGHHQEQLALFALPPNLEATEDEPLDDFKDNPITKGWEDDGSSDGSDDGDDSRRVEEFVEQFRRLFWNVTVGSGDPSIEIGSDQKTRWLGECQALLKELSSINTNGNAEMERRKDSAIHEVASFAESLGLNSISSAAGQPDDHPNDQLDRSNSIEFQQPSRTIVQDPRFEVPKPTVDGADYGPVTEPADSNDNMQRKGKEREMPQDTDQTHQDPIDPLWDEMMRGLLGSSSDESIEGAPLSSPEEIRERLPETLKPIEGLNPGEDKQVTFNANPVDSGGDPYASLDLAEDMRNSASVNRDEDSYTDPAIRYRDSQSRREDLERESQSNRQPVRETVPRREPIVGSSQPTDLDDEGYSYTDIAAMYRDTEPAWRRPRVGSTERGTRPSSLLVDNQSPRRSVRDPGPPPSTRGFDKINRYGQQGRTSGSISRQGRGAGQDNEPNLDRAADMSQNTGSAVDDTEFEPTPTTTIEPSSQVAQGVQGDENRKPALHRCQSCGMEFLLADNLSTHYRIFGQKHDMASVMESPYYLPHHKSPVLEDQETLEKQDSSSNNRVWPGMHQQAAAQAAAQNQRRILSGDFQGISEPSQTDPNNHDLLFDNVHDGVNKNISLYETSGKQSRIDDTVGTVSANDRSTPVPPTEVPTSSISDNPPKEGSRNSGSKYTVDHELAARHANESVFGSDERTSFTFRPENNMEEIYKEQERAASSSNPAKQSVRAGKEPKGILRKPRSAFPEDTEPLREGVAPRVDALEGKDIPVGARWTKIDRRLVNPQALEEAHERFEERADCVIVLRVLDKSEIQKLADRTKEIRAERLNPEDRDTRRAKEAQAAIAAERASREERAYRPERNRRNRSQETLELDRRDRVRGVHRLSNVNLPSLVDGSPSPQPLLAQRRESLGPEGDRIRISRPNLGSTYRTPQVVIETSTSRGSNRRTTSYDVRSRTDGNIRPRGTDRAGSSSSTPTIVINTGSSRQSRTEREIIVEERGSRTRTYHVDRSTPTRDYFPSPQRRTSDELVMRQTGSKRDALERSISSRERIPTSFDSKGEVEKEIKKPGRRERLIASLRRTRKEDR